MRKRTRQTRPTGPSALTGTPEAKRKAAVVLEVLSGLRTPAGAAEALGHSVPHYYTLETRGLQGLIQALEPVPRGKRRTVEAEIAALRAEKERLARELSRAQALVRASHRALGLRPGPAGDKPPEKGTGSRKRTRRPRVRARRTIALLRKQAGDQPPSDGSPKPARPAPPAETSS